LGFGIWDLGIVENLLAWGYVFWNVEFKNLFCENFNCKKSSLFLKNRINQEKNQ